MRDRQEIEREMFRAREDLEQNLDQLKHTVREKVDIPARARAAVDAKKQQVKDFAIRAGNGVKRGARASIDFTKDRPVLVGGVFLGVVLGLIAAVVIVKRRNRPWYERWYDAILP